MPADQNTVFPKYLSNTTSIFANFNITTIKDCWSSLSLVVNKPTPQWSKFLITSDLC